MFKSFRLSMTWLHTWFGMLLGFVLMIVFFFGTLSVFDREIDRWALPETRLEPQPMPSFDAVLEPLFQGIQPDTQELEAARERADGPLPPRLPLMSWSAYTTHRDPVLTLYAEFAVQDNPDAPDDHVHGHVTIDPQSGRVLPDGDLKVGSEFFYPMHYSLHLDWLSLGYWIVGLAALVMLAALVSGVVIHRRLLRELFTFRPNKQVQRRTLDLHNLTGVVALPFHFMFAFTGLVIFAAIYFPVSETALKPLADAHARAQAARVGLPLEPSGRAAGLASVDAMVGEAKRRWAARDMPGEVGFLYLEHVGDELGTVSIYRASDRVALVGQAVHFEARTGRVVHEEPPPSLVTGVSEFLTGLHLQHFEHWLLRWLYVLGGLSGTVCIATGLIFFVNKRKQRHASQGIAGARWVDALAVSSTTGMLLATLALLAANRALPSGLEERGSWQERVFWLAWLGACAHAAWRCAPVLRGRLAPAWREQSWAIAGLAAAAVVANWVSTGDHLGRTLARGYWPVAGFDLALLAAGAIAALAARGLARRERAASAGAPELGEAPSSTTAEIAHG